MWSEFHPYQESFLLYGIGGLRGKKIPTESSFSLLLCTPEKLSILEIKFANSLSTVHKMMEKQLCLEDKHLNTA